MVSPSSVPQQTVAPEGDVRRAQQTSLKHALEGGRLHAMQTALVQCTVALASELARLCLGAAIAGLIGKERQGGSSWRWWRECLHVECRLGSTRILHNLLPFHAIVRSQRRELQRHRLAKVAEEINQAPRARLVGYSSFAIAVESGAARKCLQ